MPQPICQCQTTPKEDERITTVTLEMPLGLLKQLEEAAALQGGDYREMLLCFVRDGLDNSSFKVKREQFVKHVREILAKHGIKPTGVDEEVFNKILY